MVLTEGAGRGWTVVLQVKTSALFEEVWVQHGVDQSVPALLRGLHHQPDGELRQDITTSVLPR